MQSKSDESSSSSAAPASGSTDSNSVSREEAAFEKIFQLIEDRLAKMDSKIEALSLNAVPKLQSPPPFESHTRAGSGTGENFDSPHGFPSRSRSDHRPNRQSLGSYQSHSSQDVVARVVKSSFRLDKPKFEFPPDLKNDGAFDESVLRFIDDCERHIEIWCSLPENEGKDFEGSEVFALVTLPATVQKRVAHNLDMIYEKSEISGWTLEQIQQAQYWNRASTAVVKQSILVRRAKGIAKKEAVKSIQPPAIAWPNGAGFIHLDAFEEYKSKLTTQISRLSAGGVSLSFITIKDAIISAVPDRDFKGELFAQFGHVGSLPGPTASGASEEFSMKSIFDFIRDHIVCIKQKGLTEKVNKSSGLFVSTPQTHKKFGGLRPFSGQPHSRVQAVDFHSEFPESDQSFWESRQSLVQHPAGHASDDDDYTTVNAIARDAASKDCRLAGIGPDGKLICPYLGNPETAKCGFRHPPKELELKGKGVSRATPGQTKKVVHTLHQDLGISYVDDPEPSNSDNHDS
jgi:hypothetical protein